MIRPFAALVSIIYIGAWIGAAAAGERELVAAARAGDRGKLGEEAARIGAAGLVKLLDSSDRATRAAALAAAPLAPDPWVLGPALVARLDDADRPASSAAARALATIAEGLDRETIEDGEAPPDEIAAIATGCAAAARRGDLAPDVRVGALACAAALGTELPELLADHEPEVRRAAIYALPAADATIRTALAARVTGDADVAVAATAASAICRDDPAAALAALPADAHARLRALAVDAAVEPGVVVGLIPCLRAGEKAGDKDDKATLQTLAKKGPRPVRDFLRRK